MDAKEPKPLAQWRTFSGILILAVLLLIALGICLHAGELGGKLFPDAAHTLLLLAVALAGKSSLQHFSEAKKALAAALKDDP